MKNIKTTVTGVLTIFIAVGGVVLYYLQHGVLPDMSVLSTAFSAVSGGVGLIAARDNKPSDLTPVEQASVKKGIVTGDIPLANTITTTKAV
jgi:hypothetical protein